MRIDYLITRQGEAHTGLVGGNALYAAVGAAIWSHEVGLWARLGENYPEEWVEHLAGWGLATSGLTHIPGHQDHRTFFAYTPEGRRDDTQPAAHFARIQEPFPKALRGYVHSTPGQDDPDHYEALALRPADWPSAYEGVRAVHLAPLPLRTHLEVPGFLKSLGMELVTVDPGERYMTPQRIDHIRGILPRVDAFLPSRMEVRSLFGSHTGYEQAAGILGSWGAQVVVVKLGRDGVLIFETKQGRRTRLRPFHAPGDPRVIDVTGAGDAFCGGFLVGLAQSQDPVTAARLGLVSASLVVEGYGALYALRQPAAEARRRLDSLGPAEIR